MPPRKRGHSQAKAICESQPPSAHSSLLSLPPEIRLMIWQYVLGNSILVTSRGVITDVDPHKSSCLEYHGKRSQNVRKKPPGLLSWLCTNRQIHTEVQPRVNQFISWQTCDRIDWEHLVSFPNSTAQFRLDNIQCLSVCQHIVIEHDLQDGFNIKLSKDGSGRGREDWWWCTFDKAFPIDGESLDKRMPGLKEVRVRLFFTCRRRQGNDRPVIGQYKNGRPKVGQLYRPKNPAPLICQDNDETVKELGRRVCEEPPLRMFKGGKRKSVELIFQLDRIEHDENNQPPSPHDVCWCKKRRIDDSAFPRTLLTSVIKEQLLLPEA
ncbi:hypothetical protein N7478_006116 [Penicillium angulare]|uniref:uncharacterized protein n=1 Tax=Penicillium angulare TaxID=116970 RepID=UPI002540552D|nr:uncharacterized protein N7478_006116 [Penicillium angulare]KAJ5280744.1 hypothetical protein N7478_006116 [Penicillium angulare]